MPIPEQCLVKLKDKLMTGGTEGKLGSVMSRVPGKEELQEGLRHVPGEKTKWQRVIEKTKVPWGSSEGDRGGRAFSCAEEPCPRAILQGALSLSLLPQSPREADCVYLLCTALQYTNRLT